MWFTEEGCQHCKIRDRRGLTEIVLVLLDTLESHVLICCGRGCLFVSVIVDLLLFIC